MDWQERNKIYKQVMGYDWYDITDKQTDFFIGAGWQSGIGHGKINDDSIYYLYYGSPNRNETFFTIVKISLEDCIKIKEEYKDYLFIPKRGVFKSIPDEKLKSLYQIYIMNNSNTIMEGWEII